MMNLESTGDSLLWTSFNWVNWSEMTHPNCVQHLLGEAHQLYRCSGEGFLLFVCFLSPAGEDGCSVSVTALLSATTRTRLWRPAARGNRQAFQSHLGLLRPPAPWTKQPTSPQYKRQTLLHYSAYCIRQFNKSPLTHVHSIVSVSLENSDKHNSWYLFFCPLYWEVILTVFYRIGGLQCCSLIILTLWFHSCSHIQTVN